MPKPKSSKASKLKNSPKGGFGQGQWIGLIIFGLSLVVYALFHVPRTEQDLKGMIVKCLPIVILQILVYFYGLSSTHSYGHRVFSGLILSSFGDAFLDFPGYFLHGVGSFGIAHLFYIQAFGFKPLNLKSGAIVFGILSIPIFVLLEPLSKLDTLQLTCILIYAFTLQVMAWRAIVTSIGQSEESIHSKQSRIAAGIGGLMFVISDTSLAMDRYYQRMPYSQEIVMTTYFTAQFFLCLSTLCSNLNSSTKKRK